LQTKANKSLFDKRPKQFGIGERALPPKEW
jgi:hypothetical protein